MALGFLNMPFRHLSIFFSVLGTIGRVAGSSESCEFYARKLGAPLDGWKLVSDTNNPSCIREPVDLACAGEQYYDPVCSKSSLTPFALIAFVEGHSNS